jgi:proteasome lid subunit RPN8/RPN11
MVDHCLAALPNEGCGMLAMSGDQVVKVYPTANQEASPSAYTIPPQEHYHALTDAESRGWELCGVFHSHPTGPARMSATDLARVTDPTWLYVVVAVGSVSPVWGGWRDGAEIHI